MNKENFEDLMENWIEEIENSSPDQIKQLQEDWNSMPSDASFGLPDGLQLSVPKELDLETSVQKYTVSINTQYHFKLSNEFIDSTRNCYHPQNHSIINKVRQALHYKPAA